MSRVGDALEVADQPGAHARDADGARVHEQLGPVGPHHLAADQPDRVGADGARRPDLDHAAPRGRHRERLLVRAAARQAGQRDLGQAGADRDLDGDPERPAPAGVGHLDQARWPARRRPRGSAPSVSRTSSAAAADEVEHGDHDEHDGGPAEDHELHEPEPVAERERERRERERSPSRAASRPPRRERRTATADARTAPAARTIATIASARNPVRSPTMRARTLVSPAVVADDGSERVVERGQRAAARPLVVCPLARAMVEPRDSR